MPLTSDNALRLAEYLSELWDQNSGIDGLLLLMDTCFAGVAGKGLASVLGRELEGFISRYEVLTATGAQAAYDGCFTRVLVDTISKGIPKEKGETLLCRHMTGVLDTKCKSSQLSDHFARKPKDESMYLALNTAPAPADRPWERSSLWETIDRLTVYFQPTQALTQIVAMSDNQRCVALTGGAGSGKSVLAAALAQPDKTSGVVPEGFVQAIMLLTPTTDAETIAQALSEQLSKSVVGFCEAENEFKTHVTYAEWEMLDSLQRAVLGPLRYLAREKPIRLVVDALDQMPETAKQSVYEALDQLSQSQQLEHVRLVVTARPEIRLPQGATHLPLASASQDDIEAYWKLRKLPESLPQAISTETEGSWLVTGLVASLITERGGEIEVAGGDVLGFLYDQFLRTLCPSPESPQWSKKFGPVLSVLAVAGVGATLPFRLLCTATAALDGPKQPGKVRNLLLELHAYLNHASPGMADERVGLFHATLIDYLLNSESGQFTVNAERARKTLLQAIEELAPQQKHDPKDPLHRYAFNREAELQWALGQHEEAIDALENRESPIPRENLARWQSWYEDIQDRVKPDDPSLLATRFNLANWIGRTGNAQRALEFLETLLQDQRRVQGADHLDTLRTRGAIAGWIGKTGNPKVAIEMSKTLLSDQKRVLGDDHRDTFITRNLITHWTGREGNTHLALALFESLLSDVNRVLDIDDPITFKVRNNIAIVIAETSNAQQTLKFTKNLLTDATRVLGKDHPDTLIIRGNIAGWTGRTGDAQRALELFEALLPDKARVLGKDHPDTLGTRSNIAHWAGRTGDAQRALELFEALLPDKARVLGKDHPDTLRTRGNIAGWTGRTGDAQRALELFESLLPDQVRVLGKDHPDTLRTRGNIAHWTGRTGDARRALKLFEALLPDQARVLGKDHPNTLRTRGNIAHWTGETGNTQRALKLFEALLPDQVRVLGKGHPDTLHTRGNIAGWKGRTGDAQRALKLSEALLPDQARVLGKDHPDTLRTRGNIAHWTGRTGDARRALKLSEALLPDQVRVLGKDHPDTLHTRSNIANCAGETGDAQRTLELFEALLPDRARVLGKNNPDTLRTRSNIAHWAGETGDAQRALELFEALLSDQVRMLGKDHPDTLRTRGNIAHWAGETGDTQRALKLFEALLPDQVRVLGKDHPYTNSTKEWGNFLRKQL